MQQNQKSPRDKRKIIQWHLEVCSQKNIRNAWFREEINKRRKEKYINNTAKKNHILTHHLRLQMGCHKHKPKFTRAALKITDKYSQADFWWKGSYYTLTRLPPELLKSCVSSQTKTRSLVFHGARASKSQLLEACDICLLTWTADPAHTWLPAAQESLTSARTFTSKQILNQTPSVLSLNSPLCLPYPAHDLLKLCSAEPWNLAWAPQFFLSLKLSLFFAFIIDFLKLSLFESCYAWTSYFLKKVDSPINMMLVND